MDRDEILKVLSAFQGANVEYVLIGAAAMALHGIVRATEDLDIFVRATPENLERLRVALRQSYSNDPHIEEITTDDLLGAYPAVRYFPPNSGLYLDILTRLGEASSYETVASETKDLDGTIVTVATPLALYRMKIGTNRIQDQADAAALKEAFNLDVE